MLRQLGEYFGANLYLMLLPALESPILSVPDKRFCRAAVFLDELQIPSDKSLCAFVRNVLIAGARSITCAGSAASHVHDAFDLEIVREEIAGRPFYDDEHGEFIHTSWHTEEPVDEVLWQACCLPGCDAFEDDHPAVVIILLQDDCRIPEVDRIASDLPGSLDDVVGRD